MKNLFLIVFCFISVNFYGQDLEQDWIVDTILNSETNTLPKLSVSQGFSLNDGQFEFSAVGEESAASGTYLRQQNLIILHHQKPKEELRYFNIVSLDTLHLVLSEGAVTYRFSLQEASKLLPIESTVNAKDAAILAPEPLENK